MCVCLVLASVVGWFPGAFRIGRGVINLLLVHMGFQMLLSLFG